MEKSGPQILCNKFHEMIHLSLGIISFFLIKLIYPAIPYYYLIGALVASYIPDIDHLFFMFLYGRETKYAKKCRKYLTNFQIKNFITFCTNNHKNNNFILSHNLVSVGLIYLAFVTSLVGKHFFWATVSLSAFLHFGYDITEDMLFFGHLNPNWYLKFSKKLI